MRRIFAFLSCLITMPAMAFDDACTKPNKFTVDKRCYVTESQKKTKPFNATVALVDGQFPYCTGTIVKGYHGYNGNKATEQEKNTIYVYTAKHCTDSNNDGKSDTNLEIKLQDGTIYTIEFARAGRYNTISDTNIEGDYALYTIKNAPTNIPYTEISDKWGYGSIRGIPARLVGYGTLKIMSDAEIDKFKKKYASFLKSQGQNSNVGMYNGGVITNSTYGEMFLDFLKQKEYAYGSDLFNNNLLKVSECNYSGTGYMLGCQEWGGNSGGGIFDSNGKLLGILTRGNRVIGGDEHATGHSFFTTSQWSKDNASTSIPIAF